MPTARFRTIQASIPIGVVQQRRQETAENCGSQALAQVLLNDGHTQSLEDEMAKLETIFCAMTWCLMNALLIAVAFDTVTPIESARTAQVAELAPATAQDA